MGKAKKIALLIGIGLFFLCSCDKFSLHDPEKARTEADLFLKTLYVDKRYADAYAMTDAIFQKDHDVSDMEVAISMWEKKFGKTIGFRAISYQELENRIIMVFFQSLQEKGILYHKIALKGDSKAGYKTEEVYISDQPFREYREPVKFEE